MAGRLNEDSPAYKAGVRQHDIIVSFDDRPVSSISELHDIVEHVEMGSKHPLEILRGQTRQTLEVVIEAAPGEELCRPARGISASYPHSCIVATLSWR